MKPILDLLRSAATLVLVLVLGTAAFAADPFVRATVNADGTIRPGQQIRIDVEVFVPNFFMSSPQFPVFDLPNAIVTLSDAADNLNQAVNGESFAGIRRTYLVTPQAGGSYTLPPVEISFAYAAVPGEATQAKLTLPPTEFTVEGVAAGGASGAAATAARVTLAQTFDPAVKELTVGDALVRTVTVGADGMQAMMIPEPDFYAPDGVKIYRHDPALVDEKSPRGDFVGGRRTDTVTYLFEKAGTYMLPAVELTWINPVTGKAETESAPAIDISVVEAVTPQAAIAPPAAASRTVPEVFRYAWKTWVPVALTGIVALAALLWLVLSRLPRALSALKARRIQGEHSEPAYFRRFQQACLHNGDVDIYARLDEWARKSRVGSLTDWLSRHGDKAVNDAYSSLNASVFGAHQAGGVDRPKLAAGFAAARKAWLRRQSVHPGRHALPPLNPPWSTDYPETIRAD